MCAVAWSGSVWAAWAGAVVSLVALVLSWWRSHKAAGAAKRAEEHREKVLAVDIKKAVSQQIQAEGIKEMAEHAVAQTEEAKKRAVRNDQAALVGIKKELIRIGTLLVTSHHQMLGEIHAEFALRIAGCVESAETVATVQAAYTAIKAFNQQFDATPTHHDLISRMWKETRDAVEKACVQIDGDATFNQACARLGKPEIQESGDTIRID